MPDIIGVTSGDEARMKRTEAGNRLKVMIVGAGTGGLCLAQGLNADGIAVEVFERDYSPTDRLQGYRLSIDANGSHALNSCLPQPLFEKLVQNCAIPSQAVSILDHRLNTLLAFDLSRGGEDWRQTELPVGRSVLRSILIEGLDQIVHFGKKFIAFEDAPGGGVTACFEDGSKATGDVLIGADGASSRLRGQLLPHAQRVETGIVAVSGKVALNEDVRRATPTPILRGPAMVLGPKGCFLFASAVDYADSGSRTGHDEPGASATAHDLLGHGREPYVMWGFSTRQATLALPANPEALDEEDLKSSVIALMGDWAPELRRLVETAQASSVIAFSVKTSIPIPPWRTRNVTLLGDALHNMTPFRGIGANTALRDAVALRRALRAVDRGEQDLICAVGNYEREVVDYGFRAVRTSLQNMKRFHAEGTLTRTFTKWFFRGVDRIPPLKAALLGR